MMSTKQAVKQLRSLTRLHHRIGNFPNWQVKIGKEARDLERGLPMSVRIKLIEGGLMR